MTMQPLISATRSFGNQSTMALRPAIKAAATPKPIRSRAKMRVNKPSAAPNSAAPAAATTISAL